MLSSSEIPIGPSHPDRRGPHGNSHDSNEVEPADGASRIRRFFNKDALSAIPIILIAASMLYVTTTYRLASVMTPVVEAALWGALGVSVLAAALLANRRLRPWTGLLVIAAFSAAAGMNAYLLLTPRKPGAPTALESRWSQRRRDNSLITLLDQGNNFSRVTYGAHLAIREWIEGKRIVSYDERALTRRYLESVCFVKDYVIESYPHTLNERAYEKLIDTPHRQFRFNHRKRQDVLIVVPEWSRKAKILYLLSFPERHTHVLVPGNRIAEMTE